MRTKIEMSEIVWAVADKVLIVDAGEILSHNKTQTIVNARRIAVTLCFEFGNRVNDIERYFNISRTHVYACTKRQTELNDIYPAENQLYQECKRRCEDAK